MNENITKLKELDAAAGTGAVPRVDVAAGVLRQIEMRQRFRPELAQRRVFMAVAAGAVMAAGLALAFSWSAWEVCRDPMAGLLASIAGGLS